MLAELQVTRRGGPEVEEISDRKFFFLWVEKYIIKKSKSRLPSNPKNVGIGLVGKVICGLIAVDPHLNKNVGV